MLNPGRALCVIACLALLAACTTLQTTRPNPAASLPYRHQSFDLKVAWKTIKVADGVVIEGLIKNIRFFAARDFDITVSLLDQNDRVLASGSSLTLPVQLAVNDYVNFIVKFNRADLGAGNRLKFEILYKANDGSNGYFTWLSNFIVDAATGAALPEASPDTDEW